MRVQVYRTREITSVVYGRNAENEPVSRIKMADYSDGNAQRQVRAHAYEFIHEVLPRTFSPL